MIGTIVNVIAVLIGGSIGLILNKLIPEKIADMLIKGLGFCTLCIGIKGTIQGKNMLIIIISMVVGTLIGEGIDLDLKINRFGKYIESKFNRKDHQVSISKGFVSASLLFCVGAMSIVGSLQSGLKNNNDMLYTKSMLDFTSAIIFSSSLGVGVLLAAVFILLYQGGITLMAAYLSPFLSNTTITEMTCVGSLIIIGLGFNLIGITKLKIMNFIPAIFLPIILCLIKVPDLTKILAVFKSF